MNDESERISKEKLYPIFKQDMLVSVYQKLMIPVGKRKIGRLRAKWTGEFRCPQENEWFFSGSVIMAYRAKYGYATKYCIATLVEVQ